MLKPSEIIRMAMNHPGYLAEDDGYDYLCFVIDYELELSVGEKEETSSLIYNSMKSEADDHYALDWYLWSVGKISDTGVHGTEQYKQAAFEHWNKLIEKLEKEGN